MRQLCPANRILLPSAAKVRIEPDLRNAAHCTNVRYHESYQDPSKSPRVSDGVFGTVNRSGLCLFQKRAFEWDTDTHFKVSILAPFFLQILSLIHIGIFRFPEHFFWVQDCHFFPLNTQNCRLKSSKGMFHFWLNTGIRRTVMYHISAQPDIQLQTAD